MWRMKCLGIPVITRATGNVSKGLKECGNNTRKALNTLSERKKQQC
jgi:hypothetical protein